MEMRSCTARYSAIADGPGGCRSCLAGSERHIAVGTTGLLLKVLITPASVQDRDAAKPLLFNLKRTRRRIRCTWAGAGYAGKLIPWAARWLNRRRCGNKP